MTTKDYFKEGYDFALSINELEECAIFLGQQYQKWMTYFLTEEFCEEEKPTEEEYLLGCKKMLEFSIEILQIFKKYIGYGHSAQFASKVANKPEEDEGLDAAYDELTLNEAYEAAYKQYEIQGKSKIYCNKIASTIKGRKEYPIDFRILENIIEKYEECYNKAFERFNNCDLADYYSELISFDKCKESIALGLILMKEQLLKTRFSTEYIEMFMWELLYGKNQYDELDESTFKPNAKDYWHILIIYGFTDSYFVARQNNLTEEETKRLQNYSEDYYYSLKDTKSETRSIALQSTILKFNSHCENQILHWELE